MISAGAGLWLYDRLAGSRNIAHHRHFSRNVIESEEPGLAREGLRGGWRYFDARVNSARLVLENLFDAVRMGAAAANYVEWTGAEALDRLSGERFAIRARCVVDATGAWSKDAQLRLVRGSHIVIPRVNRSENAIAFFEDSGRVVFLIPWGGSSNLTLVGTTDVDHAGSPDDVHIAAEEIAYLTGIVRRLFPYAEVDKPLATFSSLRPLLRDGSESPTRTSREHRIWRTPDGTFHVSGGKYTTYRAMSEQAADAICREIAPALVGKCTTGETPLRERCGTDPLTFAVTHEMAQHLSDVLHVSTSWGYEKVWTRAELEPLARRMGQLLAWDERRIADEVAFRS